MAIDQIGVAMRLVLFFICCPALAWSACADRQLLSCEVIGADKQLEICAEGPLATYSYGPLNAPELTLARPLGEASERPFGGSFTAEREELLFQNNGVEYRVWWTGGEHKRANAGVIVTQAGALIANLRCFPHEVNDGFSEILSRQLRKVGLCWDPALGRWSADRCP